MSSICLINPNDVNKTFDIAMFVGQTVETVRSGFFSESKFICARFKNYSERLDNNAVIGDWINELVQNNIGKYDIPETFLIGQNEENPKISIAIHPKSKHELTLPKIYVPITEELFNNGTVTQFLEEVTKFVTIEHKFISLQSNGQDVSASTTIQELPNLAKTNGLTYNFEFTQSGEERVIKRNSVTYELFETEKKYINYLNIILDFWKPKFLRSAFFTQAEIKTLFDDIPAIVKAQQAFYDDMASYKIDYSLSVLPIIMRHIEDFKVATHAIAYQQEITDLMNKKAKDARILKLIKQLAEEQNGTEFLSFMISIVQRIPRYMLFVKELNKYSPPFHPDSIRSALAKQMIDDLSKHVDVATKKANRELKLISVQSNLTNKYVILKPDRNLINCWNVTISDKNSSSGTFYVFNDIILLIRNNNKNYTIIYESDIYNFHFSYINEQTFKLHDDTPNGVKFIIIQFDNPDRFTEFFATIESSKDKYLLKLGHGYTINWEVLQTSIEFPPTCNTSCVLYDTTFIFFGGQRNDERNPTSMLTAIRLNDLNCVEITSIANGRYGHTVNIDEGKLYIIGGKNKMMEFKKFLSYNFLQQTWSQLLLNGAESFTARYGHTTTSNGQNFYIFGGRTPSGNILDDLIMFDPVKNSLTSINPPGGRPSARYRHAVVIIGDHLFLHGGKASKKEFLSDMWMLDMNAMVWQQVAIGGEPLPPRACHAMAVIGTSILIIGGRNSSIEETLPTYTIDSETFECHKVLDVGNVPHSLRKAAYTYDNNYIYLYGGIEKRMKTPTNILYKISLGSTWANRANIMTARHAVSMVPKKHRQSLIPQQSLFTGDDMDFEEIVQLTKTSNIRAQRHVQSIVEKKIISSSVKPSNEDVAAMMTAGPGAQDETVEEIFEEEEEEEDNDGMEFSDENEDSEDEGNLEVFQINPVASNSSAWKPSAAAIKERKKMDPSRPIMEVLTELLTTPVDQPAQGTPAARKPKINVIVSKVTPTRKGAFMSKRNSMIIKK
ncbi:Kelch motif family protein [Trichomonas vaginalis G3]|uniref:Kelch motif family protein n=1 Tax=Trichomonas vaginalis (strain ATCC PRA-98 / G3) TaxID=412133 RepID=A2EEA6_TRIV3|nr:Rho guanyl-nucleotide exchange factor protein [Trichomonas vaginalis G3]EAY09004.1 Kelch motif family protein [Trichomonas vaginalis G3]KAI5496287.1 Rho guanyl-nucleotide exchange factor protein [Trichomonas vaginalis G3]|eukprot:XP_001321227.1 Kelch motif family protein [Trichomonas vaginalis G3]